MGGIAAIFNLDEKFVDLSALYGMLQILNHRGPDGKGVWFRQSVALLHCANHTTPEAALEKLPAASAAGVHFLTADARLDNRAELAEALGLGARAAAAAPDSALILAAYEKWGEDCPGHLVGDFVFALWDAARRKLFAARDPLGVRHFYYYHEPRRLFALASEVKALFACPAIRRELDEAALGDYLVLNSEDKERTLYRNIRRLPATHALAVDRDGLRIRRYWEPRPDELALGSDAEYREAFREKFSEAVTSRLRSGGPVGSMLSGGLDSSSIVCVASEHLQSTGDGPLRTFSAVFPSVARIDARIDEREFIRSVVEKTGCDAHYVTADEADPLGDIEDIQHHADHPVGAPNVYMDWELYKAARAAGVKVLLSGTDGDSTVSHGYEDFTHFARRGWYLTLLRESLALSRNMPRRTHTFKRNFWHRGVARALPPATFKIWRAVRRRPEPAPESPVTFPLNFTAVRAEMRAAHALEERIVELRRRNYPAGVSRAEHHWNSLTNGHFAIMLEQLEKLAAAFGVEPRYPFFDRRLIEFCIALPPGQRINRGWTRSIFRHAMEGILPADVQWRTDKSNIGASIKINLLKHGAARIEAAVADERGVLAPFVEPEKLRAAYRAYRADPVGREPEALLLLTNVYLKNWLELNGFAPGFAEHSKPMRRAAQAF